MAMSVRRIVLLEDEPDYLKLLDDMVRQIFDRRKIEKGDAFSELDLRTYQKVEQAMELLGDSAVEVHLVITDVRISPNGREGLDVAKAAEDRSIPVIVISGTITVSAAKVDKKIFLRKPFLMRELETLINANLPIAA